MTVPIANAPAGRIEGRLDGRVARFRGIPFAEAPVGDGRLRRARPRETFRDPFVADRWGATPQIGRPYADTVIPEPSVDGDDVLTLNIVTTAFDPASAPAQAMPVLVWIHGGGYVSGSAGSPWYDGGPLGEHGVVVVTVAYRLGFDGFGAVESEANRAISDWLSALDWVRRNISAFGGDPDRVTVAGQSAGGGAVLQLLATPAAQSSFSRAVALSPVDASRSRHEAELVAARASRALGVDATLAGFRSVSPLALQSESIRQYDAGGLPFAPMHGDDLSPLSVREGLRSVGWDKPLLIGATAEEFDRPGARSPLTDSLFRSTVPRSARARAGAPAGTWLYSFDWRSPMLGRAGHCIDIPFFLGTTEHATAVLGPRPPAGLVERVRADLLDFVRGDEPGWEAARGKRGDVARVYGAAAGETTTEARGRYDDVLPLV